MSTIKVLEVVDSLQYGGVEQFLFNYISILNLSKYEITIVTMGKRYNDAEVRFKKLGINIIGITARRKNIFKYLNELKNIIKSNRYDVIHSHIDYWSFLPLFLAKKYNIKKRIAHCHCNISNKIKNKIFASITSKLCNIRIACSENAGNSMFGKNNYIVLNNAINPEKFIYNEKIRNKIRNKFNIKSNTIVIGNVGRYCVVKNQKFLIQLFYEYQKFNEDSILVLIGEGPLKEYYVDLVNNYDILDKVIFIDSVENVYDYYNMFDIFVLSSIKEGFGLVVLEAECNGLNCLVSTGVPQSLKICKTINYYPLSDINVWLESLKNPLIINRNKDNYLLIKESSYNIENVAKIIESLYSKNTQ